MAREHLTGGRDVIVPQFVAAPAYLDELGAVAREVGARHVEVVLPDGLRGRGVLEIRSRDGDIEATYRELLARLG